MLNSILRRFKIIGLPLTAPRPLRRLRGCGAEPAANAQESANNTNLLYPIHAENAIAELYKFPAEKQCFSTAQPIFPSPDYADRTKSFSIKHGTRRQRRSIFVQKRKKPLLRPFFRVPGGFLRFIRISGIGALHFCVF